MAHKEPPGRVVEVREGEAEEIQENHPGQDSMMMERMELTVTIMITRRDIHQRLMETCPMFPPPPCHQVKSNYDFSEYTDNDKIVQRNLTKINSGT